MFHTKVTYPSFTLSYFFIEKAFIFWVTASQLLTLRPFLLMHIYSYKHIYGQNNVGSQNPARFIHKKIKMEHCN